MPYRPVLPSRANAKARTAVAKPKQRPTLPAKASPKAVAAVAKVRPAKGYGRRKR